MIIQAALFYLLHRFSQHHITAFDGRGFFFHHDFIHQRIQIAFSQRRTLRQQFFTQHLAEYVHLTRFQVITCRYRGITTNSRQLYKYGLAGSF
ncbi:MAG: hypothetical protein A2522_02590 [Gallionellales bacterium RIFOXYD12_FULL_53_10]|nr:MAG: hypothetical protein A2Z87_04940 [Gallionellales bacterium GWA2_54_124]OGT19295.1 MAG: hypothetical protein A2522_02590 [Gallionellales bacterium RIFOXYD12_FULL_53_10]